MSNLKPVPQRAAHGRSGIASDERDGLSATRKHSVDLVCHVAPLACQFFKLLFDVGVFSRGGALIAFRSLRAVLLGPRHHDVQGRGQNGAITKVNMKPITAHTATAPSAIVVTIRSVRRSVVMIRCFI
jgi:hypothetical protein